MRSGRHFNFKVHEVTWSNMSNWTMHQWLWSHGSPMGGSGLPSPSLHPQHWFDVNLNHLFCVNCTCATVQCHWLGSSTEGPIIQVSLLPNRPSPVVSLIICECDWFIFLQKQIVTCQTKIWNSMAKVQNRERKHKLSVKISNLTRLRQMHCSYLLSENYQFSSPCSITTFQTVSNQTE